MALASLFRVKAGKVLANDFVSRVTLDSLGALIPSRDVTVRIEEEDSVIFDAIDQQAKDLVTLLEAMLRVFFFCLNVGGKQSYALMRLLHGESSPGNACDPDRKTLKV